VVEVMHGFIYHYFDDGGDIDRHSCCATNLPKHDDGMTTNLQEQESGQDRRPMHIEEGLAMSKEMVVGIDIDNQGNLVKALGRGEENTYSWGGVFGRS
jgi:hypothetical protein